MNRYLKKYGVDAMGAMAVAIGYALKAQPLVLFSLVPVGLATNQLGGAAPPGSVSQHPFSVLPASVAPRCLVSPPPIPVSPLPIFVFAASGFPDVYRREQKRPSTHF